MVYYLCQRLYQQHSLRSRQIATEHRILQRFPESPHSPVYLTQSLRVAYVVTHYVTIPHLLYLSQNFSGFQFSVHDS
jgi:hypothetical protein